MAQTSTQEHKSQSNTTSTSPRSPRTPSSPRTPTLNSSNSSSEHDSISKKSNPNFSGKWKLKEYVGLEEYLKSEGWNWMMRKAMAKMGNTQFIYHENIDPLTKTEMVSIKNLNKGDDQIFCNLTAKQEVRYKDRSGNQVISVFKWNRQRTEIMEFRLTEIKGLVQPSQKSSSSKRRRSKKAQKSYTESRWIDEEGQMRVSITNQLGKRCTSIYVLETDCSHSQLLRILGMETKGFTENVAGSVESVDPLSGQFPLDIVHLELSKGDTSGQSPDDDEKLNEENVCIQREIQRIHDEMAVLQKQLDIKTEELRLNVARNDERIQRDNAVRKWREFEQNWNYWDSHKFVGWVRRQRVAIRQKKGIRPYDDSTGSSLSTAAVDRVCKARFGSTFKGKLLPRLNAETLHRMGLLDGKDIMHQIEALRERYPVNEDVKDINVPGADLNAFLKGMGLEVYFEGFRKNGFEDLHTIRVLVRHKGMDYLEKNILSKKLKINTMAHRIRIMEGLRALDAKDDDEKDDQRSNGHKTVKVRAEHSNGPRDNI